MNLENKEHYENIISLLEKGLELYADENNYEVTDDTPSPIQMDKGSHARFILEQINKITREVKHIDVDFHDLLEKNTDIKFDGEMIMKELIKLKNDTTNDGTGN